MVKWFAVAVVATIGTCTHTKRERKRNAKTVKKLYDLFGKMPARVCNFRIDQICLCLLCVVKTFFCFHCQPTAEIQRYNKYYDICSLSLNDDVFPIKKAHGIKCVCALHRSYKQYIKKLQKIQ